MKLKITILIFFITTFVGFSQSLNGYKYVIIPKKYDFQKSADQYKLNSLAKFLFKKEGYQVLFDDQELPADLYENPCLALKANILDNSGMFSTKLAIELVSNCQKTVVFTSVEGKSKIKEYKKAHHEALRNAFKSVKAQNYAFDENSVAHKNGVKESLATSQTPKVAKDVVESKAEKVSTPINATRVADETDEKIKETATLPIQISAVHILYAQSIPNGFQLVDSTPKIVFKALKSNSEDVYYLENKAGVLTKENDRWYATYYKEGKLTKEELNIKF